MRLIDADKLHYHRELIDKLDRGIGSAVVVYAKEIDKAPLVEAIPIDYIKKQIEMYDGLSDIRDDRWGDIYHTFSQVLRGLIVHWRKENERFEKSHN